MREAKITLAGVTPYSQSGYVVEPKKDKEGHDAYEERTWRYRIHRDEEGMVVTPGMGIKQSIASAARFLSEKIPGKRSATYTKHFESGIMVLENPRVLDEDDAPIHWKSVPGQWFPMNADGVRGSGKRVFRCYPMISPPWKVTTTVFVLDETITNDLFERYLAEAGRFIGIGRFRPQNGGFNGRWEVEAVEWTSGEAEAA